MGYESINTTRSALSSLGLVVDGCSAGNHPLVVRFMKGVFNLRPPLPRYTETWDVQPVLQELRAMYPLHTLTLKDLTLKLVMLMALTQAARVQTLHLLTVRGMHIEQDSISVQLSDNIKQCRRRFNIRTITFQAYLTDANLCVCTTLQHYLARTEEIRQGNSQATHALLISFIKPHKAVTKDTIARWIKTMLDRAGVDTTKFTAGSVRPSRLQPRRPNPWQCQFLASWLKQDGLGKVHLQSIMTSMLLGQVTLSRRQYWGKCSTLILSNKHTYLWFTTEGMVISDALCVWRQGSWYGKVYWYKYM